MPSIAACGGEGQLTIGVRKLSDKKPRITPINAGAMICLIPVSKSSAEGFTTGIVSETSE